MKLFTVHFLDYAVGNIEVSIAAEDAAVAMHEALRARGVEKLLEKSNGVEIRCHQSRGHVLQTEVQNVAAMSPEPECQAKAPAPALPSQAEVKEMAQKFCEMLAAFLSKAPK